MIGDGGRAWAMTFEQARDLILRETWGDLPASYVVSIRMGEDPGPERMATLLAALKILHDGLQGQTQIDRRLAYCLYCLATYIPANLKSWSKAGATWRDDLVGDEQLRLGLAVESIFEGTWEDLYLTD